MLDSTPGYKGKHNRGWLGVPQVIGLTQYLDRQEIMGFITILEIIKWVHLPKSMML